MAATQEQQLLVEQHLGLVRAQAAAIVGRLPPSIDFEDLVSYGTQGLCEAAERYEPSRGVSFATFAHYRVRGAIFDGLRAFGWLNRREYARLRAEERADAYLQSRAEREAQRPPATLEDDAAALSEALAGVATVFVTSMEAESIPEPADHAAAPEEVVELGELGVVLRNALDELPEQERRIVEDFYFGGKTLLEAGQRQGLSKSWASRLHASAIDRLRQRLEPAVADTPRTARGPATAARRARASGRHATSRPPRR